MSRCVQELQIELGELAIADIQLDIRSRDDIPQILRGLQYIYTTPTVRHAIFALLEKQVAPHVSHTNGRPGMALWKLLVMGILRLDLNCDYDRLLELVNHHDTLRQMLGHAERFDKYEYSLQTLKDNVSLLTPKLLEEINQIVVNAGHALVKKKGDEVLRGRCDSFVVETDVHFPTDITLLWDATRKVIQLTARLSEQHGYSDWRQYQYNLKQVKRLMRIAQQKKRGKATSDTQTQQKNAAIAQAHENYLTLAQTYLNKARKTVSQINLAELTLKDLALIESITTFGAHADRQIEQIQRRVLQGETIASHEKVYSLFEPHTEWIMKGKAGVPVELGVRVCILEDQHQFILHHQVMEKQTDDQVAVAMVTEAKKQFAQLNTCSFDKGFHSPQNQQTLREQLNVVALPRKGKLSHAAREAEHTEDFIKARRKHSAVESAINALEVHGLDVCPDRGIEGFKRYVALAVVARNVHRIGTLLKQQEQKRAARREYRDRDRGSTFKLAA